MNSDKELKCQALQMWANYIETGNVCMSIQDAINCGQKHKINLLNIDQQKLVIKLRELAMEEIRIKRL